MWEIEDARTARRNTARRKEGRPERQEEPRIAVVEITACFETSLADVDAATVKAAGYKNVEELREDFARRGPTLFAHHFVHRRARYLDMRLHRGYTVHPSEAARDEPEPVDEATQEAIAEEGILHWKQERVLRETRQEGERLSARLQRLEREARKTGVDLSGEMRVVRERLARLRRRREELAA